MTKLEKVAAIAKRLIRSPGVIRELFDEESYYRQKVQETYGLSDGLPQVSLQDLFPDFDVTVQPFSFLDGTSLPIDIALLKALASSYKDCRYFEIGTWRGESVANVAEVAAHCITLNLPDRTMREAGLPESYISLHRFFSQHLPRVQHLQHDSRTFDFTPYEGKQDLVFIDGDHHYESVKSDTANAFRLLAGDDAVIVWHDYAFSPESIRWTVLAGILDGCPSGRRPFLYQVSNTMCAICTTRQLTTRKLTPFEKPEHHFSIRIRTQKN